MKTPNPTTLNKAALYYTPILKQGPNSCFSRSCLLLAFFIILAFKAAAAPMVRLELNGANNSLDETVIYYQAGASDGFDGAFDAYKLFGPTPAPHISQQYGLVLMQINGISPVNPSFSIHIKATTPTAGNFTMMAMDFGNLPTGTCAYLKDQVTGTSVDILAHDYVFYLSDTTTTARFVLTITYYRLPVTAQLTGPTCLLSTGSFKIKGLTDNAFNYTWKDGAGVPIKTTLNSNQPDSLHNLPGGNYSLEISTANHGCYHYDTTFTIAALLIPTVDFNTLGVVVRTMPEVYKPVNQSVNCTAYEWSFGDGSPVAYGFEPTHAYVLPGLYPVKLTGTSAEGCKDSMVTFVQVTDLATSLREELKQTLTLTNAGDNTFLVQANESAMHTLLAELITMEGKTVFAQQLESPEGIFHINAGSMAMGIYFLKLSLDNTPTLCSKVIIR